MAKTWKRLLVGKWSWKRPFISLGIIYGILSIIAMFFANPLVFPAPETPSYQKNMMGLQFVDAADGESIALLHHPARAGMPTILASHGNAEDLGHFTLLFSDLLIQGYGLAIYDYPGYGQSSGTPSEEGCYQAILACWGYLTETRDILPRDIVIFGRSVGSGPSTWLAAGRGSGAGALILLSPFTSAYRTITKYPILPGDKFPNLSLIPKVKAPLLILHGENDEVIPFARGRQLHEAATTERNVFVALPNVGHNDLSEVWTTIVHEIIHFTSERISM